MEATTTDIGPAGRTGKKKAPPTTNGAALNGNGATNGVETGPLDAFPDPGDQGVATQDDPEEYQAPEPTQQDLNLAGDVFLKLQEEAHEMGAQAVIDSLISIVDAHHQLRTPELFGDSGEDREIFHGADNVSEMARFLLRGCPKLEISSSAVVFYFKDHEKWTSGGQKVHGKVKRFDGFLQHHLEGMKAAIILNYHLFKTFNPRQKVFAVYHLLRELDKDGGSRKPDWVGYFDEPGLFGAGVYEETVAMARAFVQDAKSHVGDVYQLSILSGTFGED